jgi:hypothetical protein
MIFRGVAVRARTVLEVTLLVSTAIAAAVFAPSLGSCSQGSLVSRYNAARADSYPLDEIERGLSDDGGIVCPELELVTFAGERVRFSPPVRVVPPFAERLRQFEAVVLDVSLRHYGRAPRAVVNDGAYLCRSVRHRSYRLSEHALGNAIDVVGFDFAPLRKSSDAGLDGGAPEVPAALRGTLRVRVEKHWKAESGAAAVLHAHFLDELVRVLAERGVFRSILGPSHPTHQTHFHLDMAPWTYVRP